FGGYVADGPGDTRSRRDWAEGDEVMATGYDMPVPGHLARRLNVLRLWSARVAHELDLQSFNDGDHERAFARRNAIASLTQVLYPSEATPAGRELRFKQEYFFVSASMQDILNRFLRLRRPLDRLPDEIVVQINDTHPAMAIAELMRLLIDVHDVDWERAWHITRRTFAYTNHTLMPEALETWPIRLFATLLPRHLQIIYDINAALLREVARRHPDDAGILARVSLVDEAGERRIRMAHLAMVGSRRVNGVSAIHTELLKQTVFRDFARLFPDRIVNVTNGVTFRRWLHDANPELTALISTRLGERWLAHPEELRALAPYAEDPDFQAALRAIRRDNKHRLAALIARHCGIAVDPASLFDVHIKRMHEYKRQLLKLLHVVALYDRLRHDPTADILPRTVIYG
ncbi:MAG: glycogen/starch/alpha-glucan phosphorylase, partial [Stellaceae bacterium]